MKHTNTNLRTLLSLENPQITLLGDINLKSTKNEITFLEAQAYCALARTAELPVYTSGEIKRGGKVLMAIDSDHKLEPALAWQKWW